MSALVSHGGCVRCAAREQMLLMAAALSKLPVRVLWRLTPKEIPDKAAVEALNLGNNTKVSWYCPQAHGFTALYIQLWM